MRAPATLYKYDINMRAPAILYKYDINSKMTRKVLLNSFTIYICHADTYALRLYGVSFFIVDIGHSK